MEERFLVLMMREHTDAFGSRGAIQVYEMSRFFQTREDAYQAARVAALKYDACTFYVGEAVEAVQATPRPVTVVDMRKL